MYVSYFILVNTFFSADVLASKEVKAPCITSKQLDNYTSTLPLLPTDPAGDKSTVGSPSNEDTLRPY